MSQVLTPHTVSIWTFTFHKKSGCVYLVNLEGKFQTNLQAKPITFLVWKFKPTTLIFLLFIAEFVKYSAFYTLMLLFQRVDIFELQFLPDVS